MGIREIHPNAWESGDFPKYLKEFEFFFYVLRTGN